MAVVPPLSTAYVSCASDRSNSDRMDDMRLRIEAGLRTVLPAKWSATTAVSDRCDYCTHELSVWGSDGNKKPALYFNAEFYFDEMNCWIYKLDTREDVQGQGLGKKFLGTIMKEAEKEGFQYYSVATTDIGSYFWARMGFHADTARMLQINAEKRCKALEKWLPEGILTQASDILTTIETSPHHLQSLAELDHRDKLGPVFTSAAFATEIERLRLRDEMTTPLGYIAIKSGKHPGSQQAMTLGQTMLLGTGWEGYADFREPDHKAQLYKALNITG